MVMIAIKLVPFSGAYVASLVEVGLVCFKFIGQAVVYKMVYQFLLDQRCCDGGMGSATRIETIPEHL